MSQPHWKDDSDRNESADGRDGQEQDSVLVNAEHEFSGLDLVRHHRFARSLMEASGESDAELAVLLVSDATMRQYNQQYRGVDQATDVLSFSQREGERVGQYLPLGDIVISVETALHQADEYGHSLAEEIDELLFHGVLHLLGYDHDSEKREDWHIAEEKLIRALQTRAAPFLPQGLTHGEEIRNQIEGRKD